jgi:hypothetical protein
MAVSAYRVYRDVEPPELTGITAFATLSAGRCRFAICDRTDVSYTFSMSNVLIDNSQTLGEAQAPRRRASFLTVGAVRC